MISVEETNRPSETLAHEWNSFVLAHSSGSFYHRFEWLLVNERCFGHRSVYLVSRRAGGISGILPMTLVSSRLFGRILCSVPFLNYGGPCALDADSEHALLEAARARASSLGVKYLELRCARAIETEMVVSTRKVSMTIALQPDPEAVWNGFSSKHRTAIRRSAKNGLEVESGGPELLSTFYSVMERSWRALGTPLYGIEYFREIMSCFPDATRIFVCRRGEDPIAVAFNGYGNGTVEGMWAGGTSESRSLQANYTLYWEMMKDACLRGFSRYHLGRSTSDSGAEDFKKKWNAESSQLYWYFWRPAGGDPPALNVDNPKFRLAINAWRHLPLWATRMAGPLIARAIP